MPSHARGRQGADDEERRNGLHPRPDAASVHSDHSEAHASMDEPPEAPNVRTRLLEQVDYYHDHDCGQEECDHGTMSPRPGPNRGYGSFASSESRARSQDGYGGPVPDSAENGGPGSKRDTAHAVLGDSVADRVTGNTNGHTKDTTGWLARRHGVTHLRLQYAHSNIRTHVDPGIFVLTASLMAK